MTGPSPAYTRGTCSGCDRAIRVLKNGTTGPHTTGRPDPIWPNRSPRCPGWGRKPKEPTP